MSSILVINPNSNNDVTLGIDGALEPLRQLAHVNIDVVGLSNTPHGIQSQQDVDSVAIPVAELVRESSIDYDAFVIACFSDPGLHSAREVTDKPVLGIAQSGLLTAMNLGRAVGVISILDSSIPRHWRLYRALGIDSVIAGDLAVGAGVGDLRDEGVGSRMREVGQRLRDVHQADVLVLGCAGMAHFRKSLEDDLDIPVIDPTQAATGMAQTAVALGYVTK